VQQLQSPENRAVPKKREKIKPENEMDGGWG